MTSAYQPEDASANIDFEVPVDNCKRCTEFKPFKTVKCGPVYFVKPHCGRRKRTNPHMRGFWAATLAFTFAFIGWFAFAPLMPVVRKDIGICDNNAEVQADLEGSKCICKKECKQIIGNSNIAAVSFDIIMRFALGSVLERFGPSMTDIMLLVCGAGFVTIGAFITSGSQLIAVRFFVSMLGATFVTNQFWNSILFSGAVVGTANATAGGWGNLGGGLVQTLMPLMYRFFHDGLGLGLSLAWRFSMGLPVVLFLGLAVWMFFATQDMPTGNFDLVKLGKSKRAGPIDYLRCLKDYRVVLMCFQYGACFGVELIMNNTLAMHFGDYFGMGLTESGALAMAFGGMNLFARSLGGILSDWMASRWAMPGRLWAHFLSLFLEAIALFAFGCVTDDLGWGVALLVICILSIFVNMAEGTSYGIVPFMIPTQLAVVSALVGAGGTLGAVIGTWSFFKYVEDTLLSYKLLSVYVMVWALTVPLIQWKSMGSMFGAPKVDFGEGDDKLPSSAFGVDIADLDVSEVDGAHIVLPHVKNALQQICTEAGACFGIVWKLEGATLKVVDEYNDSMRLAEMRSKTGKDFAFTEESRKFPMAPGAGFVGRVYQNGQPEYMADLSEVTNSVFVRAELAKRFGVRSMVFMPAGDDRVLEMGTAQGWTCTPPLPYVCSATNAQFAIYWKLEHGMLVPKAHYKDERVVSKHNSLKAEKVDGDYVTEAYKDQIAPGQGAIGRVAMTGAPDFFGDIRSVSSKRFMRVTSARRFGIKSIAFMPMPGGEVVEVASTHAWQCMPSWTSAGGQSTTADPAVVALTARDAATLKERCLESACQGKSAGAGENAKSQGKDRICTAEV